MPPIMPTARPCQTCDGKRRHADRLRKPQVCFNLGSATAGHGHRRGYAIESELHKTRGTDLDIVHVFQIDQIAAMNANKALGDQATLERRDRLIDQVRSLGADGVAKIGARLKVADVCGGNEHLFCPRGPPSDAKAGAERGQHDGHPRLPRSCRVPLTGVRPRPA